MTLDTNTRDRLFALAERTREHFDSIDQTVPVDPFLVGGAVRDAVIGEQSNDLDFVVVGETPASMQEHGFDPIDASSFPVFHDSLGQEWALARTEQKDGYGYDGFEVSTDDVSLEDDLERRDLTCNSIALSPWSVDRLLVFDPHYGIADIQDGVLRHVSEAFADDPLRVLRLARYRARFGFEVAPETVEMARTVSSQLNRMSRDRIGTEITKAMRQAEQPSLFWRTLEQVGALAVIWPELDRGTIVKAGPHEYHAEGSVFEHTMLVVDRMHDICVAHDLAGADRVRRLLMAVAHDIGKVSLADQQGGIHSDDPPTRFGGHDEVGAGMMERTAERLGLGNRLGSVMADACRYHMDFFDLVSMPAAEMVDYIDDSIGYAVSNDHSRSLPRNTSGDAITPSGATPWEVLDLCHADHEGRKRMVDGEPTQPVFDPDPYEQAISAVMQSLDDVDGYEALEEGLCDRHGACDIDRTHGRILVDGERRTVQWQMGQCPDCRTPGSWVGDRIRAMQIDRVIDRLES